MRAASLQLRTNCSLKTGAAFVQVKYRSQTRLPVHKRNYARNLAAQTVIPIDTFWGMAVDTGFDPHAVFLAPRNDLDRHYAYYLLTLGHTRKTQHA